VDCVRRDHEDFAIGVPRSRELARMWGDMLMQGLARQHSSLSLDGETSRIRRGAPKLGWPWLSRQMKPHRLFTRTLRNPRFSRRRSQQTRAFISITDGRYHQLRFAFMTPLARTRLGKRITWNRGSSSQGANGCSPRCNCHRLCKNTAPICGSRRSEQASAPKTGVRR